MFKKTKIIIVISLILIANLVIGKLCKEIAVSENGSISVYKPDIEVMKKLKGTDYIKYIQQAYVNPQEKNKLMIIIRPNYWSALTDEEKASILSKTLKKWKEVYKISKPEENLEAEVCFANS